MEEEAKQEPGLQTDPNLVQTKEASGKEVIQKEETGLTRLQSEMLKTYFTQHFETSRGVFNDQNDRTKLLARISEELSVPVAKLDKLYKQGKDAYYASIKRIPAEALINQINAEAQILKEDVYNTSEKDIADKAKAIVLINDQISKVNQLYDVSPTTNIFFQQNLNPADLLNPAKFIDVKEGETNEN